MPLQANALEFALDLIEEHQRSPEGLLPLIAFHVREPREPPTFIALLCPGKCGKTQVDFRERWSFHLVVERPGF